MELRVLKYFLAVVREENITKAAEVLHITQPTLSRQLSQLEDEIGVKLFVRGTRKITLTDRGLLLKRRAEELTELADKTERELTEQEKLVNGKVSIGCGELAAVGVLAEVIKSFSRTYPGVTYDLYTANAEHIKERMDKGLTDIGLLLEPANIDNFEFIRLDLKERWVVLMPSDDALAEKGFVEATDLISKPLIFPRRSMLQRELELWFGDYYKKLNIVFDNTMSTNAAIMVEKGLGYGVVIEGSLPFLDESKICHRPFCPELTATTVFAWKKGGALSLATAKFIEHLKCFLSMNSPTV